MGRPRIGYALGGGAVRGAAHLGFLAVFEQAGIRPDVIAGTSAGAVVGAGYAAGIPVDRMIEMAKSATWREVTGAPVPPRRMSVFDATPLSRWVESAIGSVTFDDLDIPLAAMACNIIDGAPVTLTSGSVVEAAIASAAVPGLFAPVERDDMLLVDGGLVDNLPVRAARALGADVVIAVDVTPSTRSPRRPEGLRDVMASTLIIVSTATQLESRREAELLVHPVTDESASWDFGKVGDLVEAGRQAALPVVPQALELLG